MKYQRTACVDDTKSIKDLVSLIKDGGRTYKKHHSYVDNCSTVFPMKKDLYDRKFIELDFSPNLAIWLKLQIQSADFSNKQYTLHWAITKPFDKRYHYHLSDDTKHDGIFVDCVLTDFIINYNISDKIYGDKVTTHLPNTRTNIRLDFYNHWLTNLI